MPRQPKTTPRRKKSPPVRAIDENDWLVYIAGDRTDQQFRERLVLAYLARLEKLAGSVLSSIPTCNYVECEDLMSVGAIAMLDAAERYDPLTGNQFWTFATHRMWGAMMDYLREIDRLKRCQRIWMKNRSRAESRLAQQLGRRPTDEEVRVELGMSPEQWHRALLPEVKSGNADLEGGPADASRVGEVFDLVADYRTPEELTEKETFRQVARSLSMEQQTILHLYYWRGATMKRIADVMNLTESRVSQLHSVAITEIRRDLERRRIGREDVA